MASDIDEEVREILDHAMEVAVHLIALHKDQMEKLAQRLIQDERISGKEFARIMEGKEEEAETVPEPEQPENPQAGRFISPCTRKTQFSLTK